MKFLFVTCIPPLPDNLKGPTSLVIDFLRALSSIGDVKCIYIPLSFANYTPSELREASDIAREFGGFEILSKARKQNCSLLEKIHSYLVLWWPRGSRDLECECISHRIAIGEEVTHFLFYPYFFSHVVTSLSAQLQPKDVTVVGMDSATLLNLRRTIVLFGEWRIPELPKQLLRLVSSFLYERIYMSSKVIDRVIAVGELDAKLLTHLRVNAKFVHHPYSISRRSDINKSLDKPAGTNAIKLVFSKLGADFYGSSEYKRWFLAIQKICLSSSANFQVTISLHRCAPYVVCYAQDILGAVADLNVDDFVVDYDEYIAYHNIAAFPLSIGAGSKTSVMKAISLGLSIVATPIALENISYSGQVYKTRHGASVKEVSGVLSGAINDLTVIEADRAKLGSCHSTATFNATISNLLAK